MSQAIDKFRYEYGAQPLHLIATAASLLLCGYALLRITEIPGGGTGPDLDRRRGAAPRPRRAAPLQRPLPAQPRAPPTARSTTAPSMLMALNHVRIPAGLSLLLLVVYVAADPAVRSRSLHGHDRPQPRPLPRPLAADQRRAVPDLGDRLRDPAPARGAERRRHRRCARDPSTMPSRSTHPSAAFWRIGSRFVLALTGWPTVWVIATVIVGLLTNGLAALGLLDCRSFGESVLAESARLAGADA